MTFKEGDYALGVYGELIYVFAEQEDEDGNVTLYYHSLYESGILTTDNDITASSVNDFPLSIEWTPLTEKEAESRLQLYLLNTESMIRGRLYLEN